MHFLKYFTLLASVIFPPFYTPVWAALGLSVSGGGCIAMDVEPVVTDQGPTVSSDEGTSMQIFESMGPPCGPKEVARVGFHRVMISKKCNFKITFYENKYKVQREELLVSGFIKQCVGEGFDFTKKLIYGYYYVSPPDWIEKSYATHGLTWASSDGRGLWADVMDLRSGTLYEEMRVTASYHIDESIEMIEKMIKEEAKLAIFSIRIFNEHARRYDLEVEPYNAEPSSLFGALSCIFYCCARDPNLYEMGLLL